MSDLKNKPVGAKPGVYFRNDFGHLITEDEQSGITLRQHYAGLALQGILSACGRLRDSSTGSIAKAAVEWADALIEELEKTAQ